jgi:hypothetical protein
VVLLLWQQCWVLQHVTHSLNSTRTVHDGVSVQQQLCHSVLLCVPASYTACKQP